LKIYAASRRRAGGVHSRGGNLALRRGVLKTLAIEWRYAALLGGMAHVLL